MEGCLVRRGGRWSLGFVCLYSQCGGEERSWRDGAWRAGPDQGNGRLLNRGGEPIYETHGAHMSPPRFLQKRKNMSPPTATGHHVDLLASAASVSLRLSVCVCVPPALSSLLLRLVQLRRMMGFVIKDEVGDVVKVVARALITWPIFLG